MTVPKVARFNAVHPLSAPFPTLVMLFGKSIVSNPVQPENTLSPSVFILSGRAISFIDLHSLNAELPISRSSPPNRTFCNFVQPLNADAPIAVIWPPSAFIVTNAVSPLKAPFSMVTSDPGRSTCSNAAAPAKA